MGGIPAHGKGCVAPIGLQYGGRRNPGLPPWAGIRRPWRGSRQYEPHVSIARSGAQHGTEDRAFVDRATTHLACSHAGSRWLDEPAIGARGSGGTSSPEPRQGRHIPAQGGAKRSPGFEVATCRALQGRHMGHDERWQHPRPRWGAVAVGLVSDPRRMGRYVSPFQGSVHVGQPTQGCRPGRPHRPEGLNADSSHS